MSRRKPKQFRSRGRGLAVSALLAVVALILALAVPGWASANETTAPESSSSEVVSTSESSSSSEVAAEPTTQQEPPAPAPEPEPEPVKEDPPPEQVVDPNPDRGPPPAEQAPADQPDAQQQEQSKAEPTSESEQAEAALSTFEEVVQQLVVETTYTSGATPGCTGFIEAFLTVNGEMPGDATGAILGYADSSQSVPLHVEVTDQGNATLETTFPSGVFSVRVQVGDSGQYHVQTYNWTEPAECLPPPDEDGDGTPDDADECPGTPIGTPVDESGCELPPAPKKVWVCKYVGTPGVDERLKDGKNPISVAVSNGEERVPGTYFNDAQGRSFVLAFDDGGPEPDVSECPEPDGPPPTSTVTTAPSTTETTSSSSSTSETSSTSSSTESTVTSTTETTDSSTSTSSSTTDSTTSTSATTEPPVECPKGTTKIAYGDQVGCEPNLTVAAECGKVFVTNNSPYTLYVLYGDRSVAPDGYIEIPPGATGEIPTPRELLDILAFAVEDPGLLPNEENDIVVPQGCEPPPTTVTETAVTTSTVTAPTTATETVVSVPPVVTVTAQPSQPAVVVWVPPTKQHPQKADSQGAVALVTNPSANVDGGPEDIVQGSGGFGRFMMIVALVGAAVIGLVVLGRRRGWRPFQTYQRQH